MNLYKELRLNFNSLSLNRLVDFLRVFDDVLLLNSNSEILKNNSDIGFMLAIDKAKSLTINNSHSDSFLSLREFHSCYKDYLFGHLSYDLKEEIENLSSENRDEIKMPLMNFFVPELMLKFESGILKCLLFHENSAHYKGVCNEILKVLKNANFQDPFYVKRSFEINLKSRISKAEYFTQFKKIKNNIQKGDIYEMNFCQEFYSDNALIDPFELYLNLNKISPSPFSAFYRINNKFLISSSPERYLQKKGSKIISQPIKGTAPRMKSAIEDLIAKENLRNNLKERAENVMIVDLVRNDLSRTAAKASVKVDELCEIYSFKQVHQMISTISSILSPKFDFVDVLRTSFPMGSMTGAPKIRAMQFIENYETSKRGLYSGAIGYVSPNGDFDFSVVIRSIIYNSQNKYLSFMVGGAITDGSDPQFEYDECLLKAKGIIESLNS